MCISLPARIVSISGRTAEVEIDNIRRRVLLMVDGAVAGDFVLVYAGAALTIVDESAARQTEDLFAIGRAGAPQG